MIKAVVQIKRGRTAGKWRARFEEYGQFILLGIADTEAEAWKLFDEFESDVESVHTLSASKVKSSIKKIGKVSKEEWNRISREQIKELSKKYK